jgi:hypothetical protein
MSYTVHFTASGSDLRFTGALTAEEIEGALAAAAAHAYPGARRFSLVDLTGADLTRLRTSDIRAIAQRPGGPGPTAGPLAVAVVAPRDVDYGLARMWQTLAERRPIDAAVFRTRALALAWLATRGIPAAELPPEDRAE